MKAHEGIWRNIKEYTRKMNEGSGRNMKEHVGTWRNIKEYEGIRKNMNEGTWLGFLWTKKP